MIIMEVRDIEGAVFPAMGSGEERSEGVHVTTIIKSLGERLGHGYKGEGFQDRELTMDMGFNFERYLELAYKDRMAERIGEVELDGIIMSPDGVGFDPDEDVECIVLEEYKLTWKSIKQHPRDNWDYMTQIQCYLWGLELNTCITRIAHINGNYKGSGPLYRKCIFEFSDMELKENWIMITNHRDNMIKKGEL